MELSILQVLSIWIILLISEMMVWTLDLISIWLAAIFTAGIMYLTGITNMTTVIIIFAILAILFLFIMRHFIKGRIIKDNWKEVSSKESMIWLVLPVNMTNNVKTVYNEWIYIRISNSDDVKVWDMVKVISLSTNNVIVEKINKKKKETKD